VLTHLTTSRRLPESVRAVRSHPQVDRVIQIPGLWDKPHREKLQYFIQSGTPCGPDYDFETDTHSGGAGDWSNRFTPIRSIQSLVTMGS